jgi:hypothetical protein
VKTKIAIQETQDKTVRRRAACLDFPDKIELSAEAEANPKEFIRKKIEELRKRYGIE